ncbi:MAG: nucleoside triphosphate pyrophosphohydrolase [Paramuribaculum sp.]|nr:nucleoside triphosphate pyrophosphohydrolase [Paramuribaculum sp.]
MRHTREEKIEALGKVMDTLDILRVKCPWDRKQTFASLRPNTIEEVYELAEALLNEDTANIRKELGDVLLHILFYSKIGDENGDFDICDVATALNDKLIFRHPHVFGEIKADNAHQVEQNWEQIKLKEKDGNRSVLSGVPSTLPSLIKAYRIQEKAANVGFDWEAREQFWAKFQEEASEFRAEAENGDRLKMKQEMGDLLFSLVNVARLYGIHPDEALELTNNKFIRRFSYVETRAKESGRNLKDMSLGEMDDIWNEAKESE